ncbi:NtaA/DmoA family FMN-dependent monooxygenase [Paracoccus albus]|uniref:NtaA/DmoA family FMN-dependent monooxygenase n=1 Tax=Paracoccus albus TaxID=3017784 RepID=UPI0022F0EFC4|nr:NtaA/DmoA family FMN-dependent monooxygenase [Paracoccus albus]WBU62147.1 NtaA/DmoA family FMN-dependent monooxygenase [Paracoccus albus]
MAERKRQLTIGLSLTATWLKGASEHRNVDEDPVAFNVRLAQMAETAKLDFVFKPDTLFVPPGTPAKGAAPLDPTLALTAVALNTSHIGLVTTISTSFNPPYVTARQLQSLHWMSGGRAGWNIVTSLEGAGNFGAAEMPPPEARYRKAAEFVDTVKALWRSNPPQDLADGRPLPPVNHRGEFFHVDGPLNIAGHPAGDPPLFQAGASDRGRSFAASVADAIFAATPDMAAAQELRADLRRRAVAAGRPADAIRVLPGLYFFIAETREEAWALHRRAHDHFTREQRLEKLRMVLGIDLSHLPDEQILTAEDLPGCDHPVRSRTHADLLRRHILENRPTLGEVLHRPEVVGSAHWVAVGTVEDVLAEIVSWHDEGAIDGFIALPGGSEESMRLFFDQLMRRLADMGLFRNDYGAKTLAEHLLKVDAKMS